MTNKSVDKTSQNSEEEQKKLALQQLQQLFMAQMQRPNAKGEELEHKPKEKLTFKQLVINFSTKFINFLSNRVNNIDYAIKYIIKSDKIDHNEVLEVARGPIIFGCSILIIFVFFGMIWSVTAPLDSAAYAVGTVIAHTKAQAVTHREGGIIKDVLVKQGDEVKAGQALIILDNTSAKAQYHNILNQYRSALATEDRLNAEINNEPNISFSEFLTADKDLAEVAKLLVTQEHIFASHKESFHSQVNQLNKAITQLYQQIETLIEKNKTLESLLTIKEEKLLSFETLYNQGFVKKTDLQQAKADYDSTKLEKLNTKTQIADCNKAIAQEKLKIDGYKSQLLTTALEEKKRTSAEVVQYYSQFLQHKDFLERTVITSPIDGIINQLPIHTKQSSLPQQSLVAEITPIKDALVIEARIPQKNISSVQVGLTSKIKFSAFKSRTTPSFKGIVTSLSPDIVQDQGAARQFPNSMMAGGDTFYIARIEIDMDNFHKVADKLNLKLQPGMQAEIQIVTGTRTLMRYMLEPLTDNMFRGLVEK